MLNRDTLNAAASIVSAVRADVIANVVETANTLGGRAKHQLTVTFKPSEVYTVSSTEHLIAAIEAVTKEGGRALSQTGIEVAALFMAATIEQQGQRGKPNSKVELEYVGRTRKVAVKVIPETLDLKAASNKPAKAPKPATLPLGVDMDTKPRTPRAPKADAKPATTKAPRTPKAAPKADAKPINPNKGTKVPAKPRTPKADAKKPAAPKA